MTTKYTITGMTCDGCRSKVEKTLNAIYEVDSVVTLDPPVAIIKADHKIDTAVFQRALSAAGDYTITDYDEDKIKRTTQSEEKSNCTFAHVFSVAGMSCDGCRAKVEKSLNEVPDIEAVVTLDTPRAFVTSSNRIETAVLQEVLSKIGDYANKETSARRWSSPSRVVTVRRACG